MTRIEKESWREAEDVLSVTIGSLPQTTNRASNCVFRTWAHPASPDVCKPQYELCEIDASRSQIVQDLYIHG